MELYLRVRLACHVDGLSQREAASRFGIARETVKKMLRHSEPPGYRRHQPPKRPKLDPFTDIIDRILADDRTVHRKQRHTSKRIFERLRDEYGFFGGQTIVKDYVRKAQRRRALCLPQRRSQAHDRRPSHKSARRPPALELDTNIRQPLTDVQRPDAYELSQVQIPGPHQPIPNFADLAEMWGW